MLLKDALMSERDNPNLFGLAATFGTFIKSIEENISYREKQLEALDGIGTRKIFEAD